MLEVEAVWSLLPRQAGVLIPARCGVDGIRSLAYEQSDLL